MNIQDAADLMNLTYADRQIDIAELLAFQAEARIIINGLIGAMPPAQQKRWPHIIARARALLATTPPA
jgi:hypothetical protein